MGKEEKGGAATCQVCGEPLEEDLVACRDCSTLHHRSCWRYNKGCAVYGCSCRASVEVATGGDSELPALIVERPLRLDRKLRLGALAAFVVMMPLVPALAKIGPFMPPLLIVLMMAAMTVLKKGRWLIEVDRSQGVLYRRLDVHGHTVLGGDVPWVDLGDVVEIHHHRFETNRRSTGEEVWLAMADGERILIDGSEEGRGRGSSSFAGSTLADGLAAAADVTVRTFETRRAPGRAEILDAAREKALLLEGERDESDEH